MIKDAKICISFNFLTSTDHTCDLAIISKPPPVMDDDGKISESQERSLSSVIDSFNCKWIELNYHLNY